MEYLGNSPRIKKSGSKNVNLKFKCQLINII